MRANWRSVYWPAWQLSTAKYPSERALHVFLASDLYSHWLVGWRHVLLYMSSQSAPSKRFRSCATGRPDCGWLPVATSGTPSVLSPEACTPTSAPVNDLGNVKAKLYSDLVFAMLCMTRLQSQNYLILTKPDIVTPPTFLFVAFHPFRICTYVAVCFCQMKPG